MTKSKRYAKARRAWKHGGELASGVTVKIRKAKRKRKAKVYPNEIRLQKARKLINQCTYGGKKHDYSLENVRRFLVNEAKRSTGKRRRRFQIAASYLEEVNLANAFGFMLALERMKFE